MSAGNHIAVPGAHSHDVEILLVRFPIRMDHEIT